jgi:hypothetical protein
MNQQVVLRVGGICAIIGAALGLALNVIHPDLPVRINDARALIASQGEWRAVHIGIMVAILFLTYGFIALAISISPNALWGFQWLGVATFGIGAATCMVAIGLDGFADKTLADLWAASAGAAKSQLLSTGYAVQLLHAGLFYVWAGLLFGLAYVFYGLALLQSSLYAKLWGQTAVVIGTLQAVLGTAQYLLMNDSIELALRAVLFLTLLWTLLLGGLMLRNSAPESIPVAEVKV